MFQHLLAILPREPGTVSLVLALIGSVLGAGLWVAGARFSRGILTLLAVALGAAIGLKLPAWAGWSVDGMGPAVGGAVILGVSAFAVHRLWVGLWLGIVLILWASLALWATVGRHDVIYFPMIGASETLPQWLADAWAYLPGDLRRWLPCAAAGCLVCGVSTAAFWPVMGKVVLFSGAGASMLVTLGSIALQRLDPHALEKLPKGSGAQSALLAAIIAVGAMVQWKMLSEPKTADEKCGDGGDLNSGKGGSRRSNEGAS